MNQTLVPLPLATDMYLAAPHEDAAALERLPRTAGPGLPVTTCGSWTLHDLGTHLGQASRFVAAVLQTGELPREQFTPSAGGQIVDWYAEGAASLHDTLEKTDPTTPTWAFGLETAVAALWFRPVAQDTAMHLVDAQSATGAPVHVDPLIAADGTDEVFAMMAPRAWPGSEQKPLSAPVARRTTDTGHNWLIQPGAIPQARPVDSGPTAAPVEATVAELVLALQRRPRRHLEGAH